MPSSYVPVTKKGYWQIDMDDVTVSGESITSVNSAILDSGTSLIVGPSEDVKAIAAKVVRGGEVCAVVVVAVAVVTVVVLVGGDGDVVGFSQIAVKLSCQGHRRYKW